MQLHSSVDGHVLYTLSQIEEALPGCTRATWGECIEAGYWHGLFMSLPMMRHVC